MSQAALFFFRCLRLWMPTLLYAASLDRLRIFDTSRVGVIVKNLRRESVRSFYNWDLTLRLRATK